MPHAIIDWRTALQGNVESAIEKNIIGHAAKVTRHLCDTDADLTADIARLKTAAPSSQWSRLGSVDVVAARECGIAVCNVPDHAIALAMALSRQIIPLDQEAKQLGWNIKIGPKLRRLSMLTFGIVGLGRIGIAPALRAKALGRTSLLGAVLTREANHMTRLPQLLVNFHRSTPILPHMIAVAP
jgi:lactate dehydrogenase-like 2-hydroxyacid dehydrogenase